jgi:hypothetical protein
MVHPMRPSISALDLIHLQLELECIGFNEHGFLTRIAGDHPDDIARIFIAKYAEDYALYFRDDIDQAIVKRLRSFSSEQLYMDTNTVKSILYQSMVPQTPYRFTSYVFEKCPLPDEFPDVIRQDERFVILHDGKAVSKAWSSRRNAHAAELAVETDPDFRRRGYAYQVCSAWAAYHILHDRIAFYSHLGTNDVSRALAQNLAVVPFLNGINYP